MDILGLLGIGNLGGILAGIAAVLAAAWGFFAAGRSSEKKKRKIADLDQREKDREALDSIKPSGDRDTVDRLRNGGF